MTEKNNNKSLKRNLIGLTCGGSAGLFYALGNALIQYIYRQNPHVDLSEDQVIFVRSVIQFVMIGAILLWKQMSPWTGSWKMFGRLWFMGMTKVISLTFFYRALRVLPLGDATVILFTNPVFTLFLGIIFLNEARSAFNIIFGLVSFLGVAIIADPKLFFSEQTLLNGPSNTTMTSINATSPVLNGTNIEEAAPYSHIVAVGFGLMGAIMLSLYMVILKYNTSDKVDFRVALFYPSMCGLWLPPIVQAVEQRPFEWNQLTYDFWLIMLAGAVSYFIAMFLMAYALYMAEAGPAALVRNAEVIFALIFEVVIMQQIPMLFSIAGVVLILWCTSMIVFNRIFSLEQKICQKCCKRNTIDDTLTVSIIESEIENTGKEANEDTSLNPTDGKNITYTRF
ncbi:uncharacterized protein [Clytia hemisphaerica]|uniref:EamA domain-containing protein n=1 Tax=Clytia hemisphaerica TaxID=252671 RepID=A0A7M5UL26_9CNID